MAGRSTTFDNYSQRLLSNFSPLAPSKIGVEATDEEEQVISDDRRLIPIVFVGAIMLCGSFFLGLYSAERLAQCRLSGLENAKRNRWFLLSLLSLFGFFCGGSLMLLAPWISRCAA